MEDKVPSSNCRSRGAQLNRKANTVFGLTILVVLAVAPCIANADVVADFDSALAQWKSAGLRNYTFTYEWVGAVVVAPYCADAEIRVRVHNGVGGTPIVIRGNKRCPAGGRGPRSIDINVPTTINDAFEAMRRSIYRQSKTERVTASYDSKYGYPSSYYLQDLESQDSDEGFKVTQFSVQQ